eukprot:scaffold26035_cov34-Attheya_sp.AAC.1
MGSFSLLSIVTFDKRNRSGLWASDRSHTLPRPSSLEASIDVTFNFDELGRERDGCWGDDIIMVGDRWLLEAVCRRHDDWMNRVV